MYIWGMFVVRLKITKWQKRYTDWCRAMGSNDESMHFVENKASGHDIIDLLLDSTEFNMIVDTVSNELSKRARAEACTPKIEAGRVFILDDAPWADDFIQELLTYPVGRFDDQVDTLSGAIKKTDFTFIDEELVDKNREKLTF
jgi:predicted phage terminase large subunit-like protein